MKYALLHCYRCDNVLQSTSAISNFHWTDEKVQDSESLG